LPHQEPIIRSGSRATTSSMVICAYRLSVKTR
jgi:hypothetical protein